MALAQATVPRGKDHPLQATTLTSFSAGWGRRHVLPGLGSGSICWKFRKIKTLSPKGGGRDLVRAPLNAAAETSKNRQKPPPGPGPCLQAAFSTSRGCLEVGRGGGMTAMGRHRGSHQAHATWPWLPVGSPWVRGEPRDASPQTFILARHPLQPAAPHSPRPQGWSEPPGDRKSVV